MRKMALLKISLCIFVSMFAFGCGSGSSDFFGAAITSIEANPTDLFIADRTLVTTTFDEVNTDGIVARFRYPTALSYFPGTAKLIVGKDQLTVNPIVNTQKDTWTYLVFVFSGTSFSADHSGKLQFQLVAGEAQNSAPIEVHPVIRNKNLTDSQQFDIENPLFATETEVTLKIRGAA